MLAQEIKYLCLVVFDTAVLEAWRDLHLVLCEVRGLALVPNGHVHHDGLIGRADSELLLRPKAATVGSGITGE